MKNFIIFLFFISLVIGSCNKAPDILSNKDLIFSNSLPIRIPAYTFSVGNTEYTVRGDTSYFSDVPDTLPSTPVFEWDSVNVHLIYVGIFTAPIQVTNGNITNSSDLVLGTGEGFQMVRVAGLVSGGFRRDVEAHHQAGIHGNEVDLRHVGMQTGDRLVDHAALIAAHQIERAAGALHLLLVPGNQDAPAQGSDDLHGGNARTRRKPGGILDGQGGDAGELINALHAKIMIQQGVGVVNVPAPEQVYLLAAVDDLPVGKIGMLGAHIHGVERVAVESRRLQVRPFSELQQVQQQPAPTVAPIPPGGEQQVGVVALEDRRQVDQQGPGRVEWKAVREALETGQHGARRSVGRIAVKLQGEGAQRRRFRVQVPGSVEGRNALYPVMIICLHPAARQGKAAVSRSVAQGQRDIGVVVGQIWESLLDLAEKSRLAACVFDAHRQHRQRLRLEQVPALLARKPHTGMEMSLQEAP